MDVRTLNALTLRVMHLDIDVAQLSTYAHLFVKDGGTTY